MPRRPILAGAVLAAALSVAGCGDDAASPTSPTSRNANHPHIGLSGCGHDADYQCKVTLFRAPDVVDRDVTAEAAFTTSPTAIATIEPGGRVTGHAPGTFVITATYQGMQATKNGTVLAAVELFGVVEDWNESWTKVPGARIEFVQGPNTGLVTTTDSNGFYTFPRLMPSLGGQVVRISHPNYRTGDFWPSVWENRANRFNPRLTPLTGLIYTVDSSFSGELSTTDTVCDLPGDDFPCRLFTLPSATRMTMAAELTWNRADLDLDVVIYRHGAALARSTSAAAGKDVLDIVLPDTGPFELRVIVASKPPNHGSARFTLNVKRS